MNKIAPLDSGFMAIGIIGFLISFLWVYPRFVNWGITFLIFFGIMISASLISMHYADTEVGALDALAIDKLKKK